MIYYIMGKSASGKDSIYKELLNRYPHLNKIVLYTTRPVRTGEIDGINYNFLSDEEMDKIERTGNLIESRSYNTVYGIWRYATVLDKQFDDFKNRDFIVIGTLESYVKMKEYFGNKMVFPIYIEVPDEIRYKRAMLREKSESNPKIDEMRRRFIADEKDFSEKNLISAGIERRYINIDMERCIDEIIKDTKK